MDFSLYREKTAQIHQEQVDNCISKGLLEGTAFIGDSYFHRPTWVPGHQHLLADHAILAVGGDRMEHLAWRLQRLPESFAFNKIYLLIGLNNIMMWKDTPANKQRHLQTLNSIIEYVCQRFPLADVNVVDYPIYPSANCDRVQALNAGLAELPSITGCERVKLVRPWSGLTSDMFEDEVHLNLSGYEYFLAQLLRL